MIRKKRRFSILNLLFRRKKETIYIKKELKDNFSLNKNSKRFENKTIWPYHASLKDDKVVVIDTANEKKTEPVNQQLNLIAPNDLKFKSIIQQEQLREKEEDIKLFKETTDSEYDEIEEKIEFSKSLIPIQEEDTNNNEVLPILYEILYDEDINNKKETKEEIESVKDYAQRLGNASLVDDNLTIITDEIEQEKKRLSVDEVEFEKLKDEFVEISQLNDFISKYLINQQNEIGKIIKKVDSNQAKIERSAVLVQEKVTSINKILLGTSLLMSSPMIPRTRGGRLLRLGMVFAGLFSLSTATNIEKRPTYKTKIIYEDYTTSINQGITDLNYVSDDINSALDNINNLKLEFHKYKEYKEFDIMMKTLDDLEYKLLAEYRLLKEYNDRLNNALSKNNAKVKKIEDF